MDEWADSSLETDFNPAQRRLCVRAARQNKGVEMHTAHSEKTVACLMASKQKAQLHLRPFPPLPGSSATVSWQKSRKLCNQLVLGEPVCVCFCNLLCVDLDRLLPVQQLPRERARRKGAMRPESKISKFAKLWRLRPF